MTTEEPLKRKATVENDDSGKKSVALKRMRSDIPNIQSNVTSNFMPRRGNKFLLVHLQLLRALYGPLDTSTQGTKKEDGTVEVDFFETIQKFLKQRKKLQGHADHVKMYQQVQAEAFRLVKEEKEIENTLTNLSTPKEMVPKVFMRQSMSSNKQQSPYASLFSGSQQSQETNGGSLLTLLLKRKYLIAAKTLKKETLPFKSLRMDVRQRVETIESLMAKELNNETDSGNAKNLSDGKNEIIDDEESIEYFSRLETKLNLWKLLLLDLERSE